MAGSRDAATGFGGLMDARSSVAGVRWPPVLDDQSAILGAFMHVLERTQWLPPAEIAAGQDAQLRELVRHHARRSPFFKDRLRRARLKPDDLESVAALSALPRMTRRQIQDAGDTLFATQVPEGHQPVGETRTSGSTGEPTKVQRTSVNRLFWLAGTMRDHLWHERDFKGRFASIRINVDRRVEGESWGAPVSLLFQSGRSMALPIDMAVSKHFDALAEFRPNNVLVYPSTLDMLVRFATETGRTLPSVRQFRCIGETVTDALRESVRETLGASIAASYSSEECGTIALQCPVSGQYHVMAENHFIEVLDEPGEPCRPGEIGRIAVTDLHNFATPLIRYDINDYAEVGPPCPCGRGLPTLTRILGRKRNLFIRPDGSEFWPTVRHARLRELAPIRRYQLVQTALDEILVRLVVSRAMTEDETAALTAAIRGALGTHFRLTFEASERDFPPAPAGKFEEFVCRIEPPPRAPETVR